MPWSQSDLDAIRAAYALGAVKVRYADGREVTYRSLADMRAIIDDLEATLGAAKGLTRVAAGYRSGLLA